MGQLRDRPIGRKRHDNARCPHHVGRARTTCEWSQAVQYAGLSSQAGDLNESRAKGYRVSNRGRVSAKVVKAYDAAH